MKEREISFDSRSASHSRHSSWPHTTDSVRSSISELSNVQSNPIERLTDRLKTIREEGLPKANTCPPLSEELAPIVELLLEKPDFHKTMKLCEKLPRPENVHKL